MSRPDRPVGQRAPTGFDVVVVGAGAAGLRAALAARAAGASVAVLCKSLPGKAATVLDADGIAAAAAGSGFSRIAHFRQTMRAGAYAGDWRHAWLLAREAPGELRALRRIGALLEPCAEPDDASAELRADVARFGGARAGQEVLRVLRASLDASGVTWFVETVACRLFVGPDRAVRGVGALRERDGEPILIEAAAVVLATGRGGRAWSSTTGVAADETGDGVGLAFAAGADLVDMEFNTPGLAAGGIRVDADTGSVGACPGVHAAGDVLGGVHGAGLLRGNALAAALVTGACAGRHAAGFARSRGRRDPIGSDEQARFATAFDATAHATRDADADADVEVDVRVDIDADSAFAVLEAVQDAMSEGAGADRSGAFGLAGAAGCLSAAHRRLAHLVGPPRMPYHPARRLLVELPLLISFARALVAARLARTESRGSLRRYDHGSTDPGWDESRLLIRCGADGVPMVLREQRCPLPVRVARLLEIDRGVIRCPTRPVIFPPEIADPSISWSGAATATAEPSSRIR